MFSDIGASFLNSACGYAYDFSGNRASIARAHIWHTAAAMAETLPLAATVPGELRIPSDAHAVVMVACDSPHEDRIVQGILHHAHFATLHIAPPLEPGGGSASTTIRHLTEQLLRAARWLADHPQLRTMRVGIFGSELCGGAALAAAAARPDIFRALVVRDGHQRLAGSVLNEVRAATLLIVDGHDEASVALNQDTMTRVRGIAELEIVPTSHVAVDDPDPLARVAGLTRRWFVRFLG